MPEPTMIQAATKYAWQCPATGIPRACLNEGLPTSTLNALTA